MTALLSSPATDTPSAAPRSHLLAAPQAPLVIRDLVHPARGHIAATRDGVPHVIWNRGQDRVMRAECGGQGIGPTDTDVVATATDQQDQEDPAPAPAPLPSIATWCGDCQHQRNLHLAAYGLPALELTA